MLHRVAVTCVSSIALVLAFQPNRSSKQSAATTIAVRGFDFALQMPDSIRAGTHSWTFRNDGQSRHELILARLQPGTDTKAAIDSLHARGLRAFFAKESVAIAVGALFAPPGTEAAAEIVTHDCRGDVLLVFCQLRETPDKPKHDDLGMFKVVGVN